MSNPIPNLLKNRPIRSHGEATASPNASRRMDTYSTPLGERYASKQMKYIFSPRNRISTWRQLWVWLAESQQELGLDISKEAISELRKNIVIKDEEFEIAAVEEKRRRHDVMAHVHTYGLAAPAAAGIIHWGATSWCV